MTANTWLHFRPPTVTLTLTIVTVCSCTIHLLIMPIQAMSYISLLRGTVSSNQRFFCFAFSSSNVFVRAFPRLFPDVFGLQYSRTGSGA